MELSFKTNNGITVSSVCAGPKSFRLNNGLSIPSVGLGTWRSAEKVYEAVRYAIAEAGYRHIDCAFIYQNEEEVGRALTEVIKEGIVKREELFITTKCWSTYHSKEKVMKCLQESLSKLGLDYVDLYLIHWPMGFKEDDGLFPQDQSGKYLCSDVDYLETWEGMEECLAKGLTKSIGLSNFNVEQVKRVLSACNVKPVMNQIECHPYSNSSKMVEFCKAHDIRVTAYSPLGSPGRKELTIKDPVLSDEPILKKIAEKYNKKVSHVLLRYQLQRGVIVIPKSTTPAHILSNIQVFDFKLTDTEMADIDELDNGFLFVPCTKFGNHKDYPLKHLLK